jgi:hypothetical protein
LGFSAVFLAAVAASWYADFSVLLATRDWEIGVTCIARFFSSLLWGRGKRVWRRVYGEDWSQCKTVLEKGERSSSKRIFAGRYTMASRETPAAQFARDEGPR